MILIELVEDCSWMLSFLRSKGINAFYCQSYLGHSLLSMYGYRVQTSNRYQIVTNILFRIESIEIKKKFKYVSLILNFWISKLIPLITDWCIKANLYIWAIILTFQILKNKINHRQLLFCLIRSINQWRKWAFKISLPCLPKQVRLLIFVFA